MVSVSVNYKNSPESHWHPASRTVKSTTPSATIKPTQIQPTLYTNSFPHAILKVLQSPACLHNLSEVFIAFTAHPSDYCSHRFNSPPLQTHNTELDSAQLHTFNMLFYTCALSGSHIPSVQTNVYGINALFSPTAHFLFSLQADSTS